MLPLKWEQASTLKSVFQLIIKIIGERVFMWNGKKGKESKVAERQKGSERVCVCVHWSKPTTSSISIHNSVGERNTSMAITDCRHLWLISEDVWEVALLRFLTVSLLFSSNIWISDSLTKGIASSHGPIRKLQRKWSLVNTTPNDLVISQTCCLCVVVRWRYEHIHFTYFASWKSYSRKCFII